MSMDKGRKHSECPRKLNFSVPLLSTKRPLSITTDNTLFTSNDTRDRVPFSWERIPGEPKENDTSGNIDVPPTPKPPPCRWRPPPSGIVNQLCEYDVGFEGDGDDDEEEEEYCHKECYSDAIDIFSLAESVDDDVEENCKATKGRSSTGSSSSASNFIIQRFLPDAEALAVESVANNSYLFSTSLSGGVGFKKSCPSSLKGYGFGSLFPWRMKTKLCSVKTPVCDTIIGANSKQNQ